MPTSRRKIEAPPKIYIPPPDRYKFVSIHPSIRSFCRHRVLCVCMCVSGNRVLLPRPVDFNFVWICKGEFHFVSYYMSAAAPIRGMKWRFDIISGLSIFSPRFLSRRAKHTTSLMPPRVYILHIFLRLSLSTCVMYFGVFVQGSLPAATIDSTRARIAFQVSFSTGD